MADTPMGQTADHSNSRDNPQHTSMIMSNDPSSSNTKDQQSKDRNEARSRLSITGVTSAGSQWLTRQGAYCW